MKNTEELQYIHLLENIINNGSERCDRTGVGTRSVFGTQLRFSLANNVMPVLTTKKIFIRGCVEELLFFINGKTNTKELEAKGVNIWKGNTTREFLNKRGLLDLPEGDMGKSYSFQWRNFGGKIISGKYNDHKKSPMDRYADGVDQISSAFDLIKNDPYSRKIIVSAWNPKQSNDMALEPCHCLYQFYVDKGKLSLQWYQRSVDVGLGLPFKYSAMPFSPAYLLRPQASNQEKLSLLAAILMFT